MRSTSVQNFIEMQKSWCNSFLHLLIWHVMTLSWILMPNILWQ